MNEFQIQRDIVRSLKTAKLRMWGRWQGDTTTPRWQCTKNLQHQFNDTVDAVADREKRLGFGCPRCEVLAERITVPFEEFAPQAIEVNERRAKQEKKARSRANRGAGSHAGLDRYAI